MHHTALDARAIAAALGGEVVNPNSILAPGPNHSPGDRSLSVKLSPTAPDGFTVHSFANQDWRECKEYVRQKVGLPERKPRAEKVRADRSRPVAEYVYRDQAGTPYLKVLRFPTRADGKKDFRQMGWNGQAWDWGRPKGPKIPYHLPDILRSPHAPVFVVEGEKDADRLAAFQLVATTSSEGAGKWTPDLNEWFRGRTVFVLPDNDETGRKHAHQVAENLHGIAAEVRIVPLPGLPEKGDVSDWLAQGGDPEELMRLCDAAPVWAPEAEAEQEVAPPSLAPSPQPFVWRDPATIPPRPRLYGFHIVRRQVSVTVAPSGLGKSSLSIVDAIAMASGRDLLSEGYIKRLRVWLINLEDPREELERRVTAAMIHHGVGPEEVAGYLFLSGREEALCTAVMTRGGVQIVRPAVDQLEARIRDQGIDVLSLDPFISSHEVPENDNGAIDKVAKEWARVADRCNCGVEIVHHTRKLNGEDGSSESGRGASALLAAARSGRVLNRMSDKEKAAAGLKDDPATYFSALRDKANLAPLGKRAWRRLVSVDLGNGDLVGVGVVERWEWPDTFEGISVQDLLAVQRALDGKGARYSDKTADWAGHVVAETLGLDANEDRARIKKMIETWLASGALVKVDRLDAKRMPRPCLEVGEWATE